MQQHPHHSQPQHPSPPFMQQQHPQHLHPQQHHRQPPPMMGMQPPPSSFPSYSAAAAAASSSSSLPPPPMAARPAMHPYGAGVAPHPQQPQQQPPANLPKQQIASVLNAMTAGGNSHFQSMDGYDLANLHAMNVRYLQQVASQRSYQHHPGRRPDMAPPSTALFAAKM